MVRCFCFKVSYKAVIQASAGTAFIPPLGEGVLPSSLTWLLAGFSSSQVVGLRVSVVHCLLAGGHPQFLPM